jgi:selenocysteine-specific elongation factor
VVDVPGHADFIKTMVTGACGMDFVMLIIAADEGIMPQTREHLAIMQNLGLKKGLVALNKIDLVDTELLELAQEEVKEFVAGSFLQDAPVIPVSSTAKKGIEELINALMELLPQIPEKSDEGIFRMYIDRIFSQPGFGTIVNGSVLSGWIGNQDTLYLLPGKREVRVRKLQRHGADVDRLKAGDRGSLNLVNLKIKDFRKGMMLASEALQETKLCDARISLFNKNAQLGLWSQAIFLLGTIRQMVRIHLLDKDLLEGGEEALVQIYLPHAAIVQFDDAFIIRNSSGNETLGGGRIVDPYPLHHRRRRSPQIEIVQKMASGDPVELLSAEVRKAVLPVSYKEIARQLNRQSEELIAIIFQELPGDLIFFQTENDILLLEKKRMTGLQNKVLNNIRNFHIKNPLLENGRGFNELMGIFGTEQNELTRLTLEIILNELLQSNKLKLVGKSYVLFDHKINIDQITEQLIRQVGEFVIDPRREFTEQEDIYEKFLGKDISKARLDQVIGYFLSNGTIKIIQKKFISAKLLEKYKQLTLDFLLGNPEGISVAQFRDLIKSNRSNAMAILEYFDSEGMTLRKGNFRVLTRKYLNKI